MSERPRVTIWTDGACSGNPGPGGWGAVLAWHGHEKELCGGEAAHHQQPHGADGGDLGAGGAAASRRAVDLYTNSQYLRGGITGWIKGWKKNGWRTERPQAGQERRPLAAARRGRQARTRSPGTGCSGHAGTEANERADALAREGMEPFQRSGERAPNEND